MKYSKSLSLGSRRGSLSEATPVGPITGPLATNLISYWSLEEDSGSIRTDGYGSMDMSEVGAPARLTGANGFGIYPSRVNSHYVSRANALSAPLQPLLRDMAVSLWFKPLGDPMESSWHDLFFGGAANSSGTPGYNCAFRNDGRLYGFWSDGSSRQSAFVAGAAAFDTMTHCVLNIKRGSVMEVIADNGTPATVNISSSELVSIQSDGDFAIGGGFRDSPNALIDEVSVWGRSLTEAEITALFNSGTALNMSQVLSWTP